MSALLAIKNLKKTFSLPKYLGGTARGVLAVDRVDLVINEGEHLGLVGESGSGKSTLARLVVKLYRADEGEIVLDGDHIIHLSQRRFRSYRRKVQMVFQDPHSSLDSRFSVRRILKEAMALLPERISRKEQDGMMKEALQVVGLSQDVLLRFPHEFSGGERQRIAIARALIMKPKLLILDEAVSSLDVLVQAQIIALLQQLQAQFGLTYLFITHNLRAVRRLCNRIAVMYQGKIVETAPTEELFARPLHPYTQQLLTAAMDYKSSEDISEEVFTENSRLIDEGNGHFVLK